MKRLIPTLVLMMAAAMSFAQQRNPYIAPVGVFEAATAAVPNMEPRTVLAVDVTVQCDRTICGPYARYAQKYLGVRAPLTDKTECRITGGSIALAADDYLAAPALAAPETKVVQHATSDSEFTRVQPDRRSSIMPASEDAAAEAAKTIFSLRKHRMELITGDAGENVFGAGLQAALDEIARQEQAYLELFLGKHIATTETRRCYVFPEAEKRQYVVCRFNAEQGVLPASDLTGEPVLLQITPAETTPSPMPEADPRESNIVRCRVANIATCRLSFAGAGSVEAQLPIFEFGRTINYALPRKR